MKNIFYFSHINKIGGIETFFYQLAKKYKDWDLTVYYRTGDPIQLERLKQFVRVKQYKNEIIECDKAFFNFNTDIINNVKAKEYNLVLHGDYKAMVEMGQLSKKELPLHPKINNYYGVSQLVCDTFHSLTGKKVSLVYNPFEVEKPKKILHLISATRLTAEKGKKRMIKLANALDAAEIPYEWIIYTNDTKAIDNPNIVYRKPRLDIVPYIADADYLVQLSDNEGYCYSVVEALSVGTPVIVTDLPVFREIGVNKTNSFVLPMDMSSIPVNDIYNAHLNFTYTPKKDNWDTIFEPGPSTYQEEKETLYTVEALRVYQEKSIKDSELNRIPQRGEQWETSKERLDILLGDNRYKQPMVKLVGTRKRNESI